MSAPPPDSAERVARAMLSRYEQLLSTIADRVRGTLGPYSHVDPDELRDRVAQSVQVVIVCLIEGRRPDRTERESSAVVGGRRALQGVPVASMIQSFRIAERVLGDELQMWCARMNVRTAAAQSARASLIASLDILEEEMLRAYAEMQRQVEEEDRLSESAFIRRMLDRLPGGEAEIERLAAAVGIADAARENFTAICVDGGEVRDRAAANQGRYRLVATLARRLGVPVISDSVITKPAALHVLVLPWARPPEALRHELRRALDDADAGWRRAAIGTAVAGLGAAGGPCRQAVETVEVMRSSGHPDRIAVFADMMLEVLVHRERTLARQIADHALGPLHGAELLETLRSYLANDLALTPTAAALGVHRNTVVYRVHKIEELTGLELRKPRDLARVVIGLAALCESQDAEPATGS